jgi:hypothetical protein
MFNIGDGINIDILSFLAGVIFALTCVLACTIWFETGKKTQDKPDAKIDSRPDPLAPRR